MNETLHWESFYVIIGSSAVALTGADVYIAINHLQSVGAASDDPERVTRSCTGDQAIRSLFFETQELSIF